VGKNLEKEAEESASLYSDEIESQAFDDGEWPITAARLEGTRDRRYVVLFVGDASIEPLRFQSNNPMFAPTSQLKFFYRKQEAELEKMLGALAGEPVNIRGSDQRDIPVRARLLVKAKKRVPHMLHVHRPFDTYRSFRLDDLPAVSGTSEASEGSRDSARLPDMAEQERVVRLFDPVPGDVR
jgi:hypothetical protein